MNDDVKTLEVDDVQVQAEILDENLNELKDIKKVLLDSEVPDKEFDDSLLKEISDIKKVMLDSETPDKEFDDSLLKEISEIKTVLLDSQVEDEVVQADLSEQDYTEILLSIEANVVEANSYLYTINVYFAGFFVITLLVILTKMLIGFFKPFL